MVPEENMTWIHLGREVLLEKFVIAVFLCAQTGVLAVLAVPILPLISEILQLRSRPKQRRRAGGSIC
jgi:hypothetical protein